MRGEVANVVCLPSGSIVEVFFNIDIDTYIHGDHNYATGGSYRALQRMYPVFATGQSVRPGPGRGRTTFRRPVPSFPELARQIRAKDQDGRHCVVPHRPPPSSAVFRCFLLFSAVPRRPRRSYVVTCRPLAEVVSGRGARRPC